MPTQRKIESVADLTDKLTRTQFTVVADYRGLSVAEITDLRRRLRETGAELVVAKNALTLRAGPTALAFAYDVVAKTAKEINDFNRGPKKLVVRGGMLGRDLLSAQHPITSRCAERALRRQTIMASDKVNSIIESIRL